MGKEVKQASECSSQLDCRTRTLGHVLKERSGDIAEHLCRTKEPCHLRDINGLSLNGLLSHRPRNIEQQKLFREAGLRRALVVSIWRLCHDLRT